MQRSRHLFYASHRKGTLRGAKDWNPETEREQGLSIILKASGERRCGEPKRTVIGGAAVVSIGLPFLDSSHRRMLPPV